MAGSRSDSPFSGRPSQLLEGIAGSPGLAIGRAVVVDVKRPGVVRRHIAKHLAADELSRFDAAVVSAARSLREVAEKMRDTSSRAESSILEAYVLMVEDESLREDVERRVKIDQQCAEWALESSVSEMAQQLRHTSDPYLAERSHDFEFVGNQILMSLSGRQRMMSIPDLEEPAIIVARDLSPAETAVLDRSRVQAMVTEVGTNTSHTAILARSLEIPAVVGVRQILSIVGTGDQLVVDGTRGTVTVSPSPAMVGRARARAARRRERAEAYREAAARPAMTRCGKLVELHANIELPSEANIALAEGATGIGLYRTEFLYVDRREPPGEQEQYDTYRRVLESVSPRPVTLRTFDIGGDKFVSAFMVPPDMNPALGLRAVRLALARPELFTTQLRAMIRASAHGDLRIMIPMIASVEELTSVRELFDEARRQVERAGHEHAPQIPLGIMIEVPSAALMAAELSRYAEFLSIGTNDLVQYALAVDRTNRDLAYLATPFNPAILRLIQSVVQAGTAHDRPVSVCGAMASNPLAAVLLVGMGLRTLSMEAAAIAKVKESIGRIDCAEVEGVAQRAVKASTAKEAEAIVSEAFADRLADVLDGDEE